MAKQTIGKAELHVEKLVLGLCGAALLGAIAMFGINSPSRMDVEGEDVAPATIDERVRAAGVHLGDRLRSARHERIKVPNYGQMFDDQSGHPLELAGVSAHLARATPFSLDPPMGPESAGLRKSDNLRLANFIAPAKPLVGSGRSTVMVYDRVEPESIDDWGQEEEQEPQDVSWVTVAARFDRIKQEDAFLAASYPYQRHGITFLKVLLQRSVRQRDGSWGPWQDVSTFSRIVWPPMPTIEVVPDGEELYVDDDQKTDLQGYFETMHKWQDDIARPQFADVRFGDTWQQPEMKDVEWAKLDARYVPAEKEKEETEVDKKKEGVKHIGTRKQAIAEIARARILMEQGKLEEARAVAAAVEDSGIGLGLAEQDLINLLIELEQRMARAAQETPEGGKEEEKPELTYDVLWAHDLSAEPGQTYRYRIGYWAYNTFAAIFENLENEKDAEIISLQSTWSEPSDPLTVPASMHFWLASAKEKKQTVGIEVYKWVRGIWTHKRFYVGVGQALGGKSREKVPGLEGGDERITVTFDTGATILDIDWDRPFKQHSRSGAGFEWEADNTVALAYVDRDGRLQERLLDIDRRDPEFKRLKDEAKERARVKQTPTLEMAQDKAQEKAAEKDEASSSKKPGGQKPGSKRSGRRSSGGGGRGVKR